MLCEHLLSHLQPTALHFYKSDYNIDDDEGEIPTWSGGALDRTPAWVGQDITCNDGGKVDLLTADITLDKCGTKCEQQPGCFLFEYTENSSGDKTCKWQKTASWGRCNNYDTDNPAASGDFKGLFLLRTGAWTVPLDVYCGGQDSSMIVFVFWLLQNARFVGSNFFF